MANLNSIAMLAEVDGLLLIDKPCGISSHDVVKAVKTHFNLVKVGHGATLETNANGLFIVLLGNATRLSDDLMNGDNACVGKMFLGKATNTYDCDGEIVSEKGCSGVTRETFDAALPEFRGDVFQLPPMYSAVRMNGESSYTIVQTAKEEERKARLVHVYRFAVTDFALPYVSFELSYTKGMVPRTLVNDFGEFIGVGATLEELRRVKSAGYVVEDAIPFMDLLKLDPVDFKNRVLPLSKVNVR